MKEFARYDVFDYLEMEVRLLTRMLDRVIGDYFHQTNDQRGDQIASVFQSVERHVNHQDKIMKTVALDSGLERVYLKFKFYRDQIKDLMNDMVFEHLDDDSFYSDLKLLRALVAKLARLEHMRLFARLREGMSDEARLEAETLMGAF